MDMVQQKLTPEYETGMAAEQRVLLLCNSSTPPAGVLRATLGNPRLDALGVDCLIWLKCRDGRKIVVPVQIKSSYLGREAFFAQYKKFWFWRMPVIIAKTEDDDRVLQERISAELEHARRGHYDFRALFADLREQVVKPEHLHSIAANRDLYHAPLQRSSVDG